MSWLLDGRVRHEQQANGHRSGIEPVLLAAFVPARAGDRVLEGGTGSGAALLCLAHRVAIEGVGVELLAAHAAQARANVAANGFAVRIIEGDLATVAWEGRFDHAMANPPWHDTESTASADAARALAKRADPQLFAVWAASLARGLRHRGTLSFVTGAGTLSDCLAAFTAAGCGSHVILPLWPRAGRAPKLVLLQGVRGGRSPTRLLPGLVLHAEGGGYTEAAEAVLRAGTPLPNR